MAWFWPWNRVRGLLYLIRRNHEVAFVTSIDLIAGGDPVHVAVTDQNGNALDPNHVGWNLHSIISQTDYISYTKDSTGFIFKADSASVDLSGTQTKATYMGPGVNTPLDGPELTINIALPAPPPVTITSLQYMSP